MDELEKTQPASADVHAAAVEATNATLEAAGTTPANAAGTTALRCPKDGTAMEARGRRAGAWRCSTCGGMFIDVARIRRYGGQRRPWAPVVVSVLLSLLATYVVRRLRRRSAG